jgi:hypothetical protein
MSERLFSGIAGARARIAAAFERVAAKETVDALAP